MAASLSFCIRATGRPCNPFPNFSFSLFKTIQTPLPTKSPALFRVKVQVILGFRCTNTRQRLKRNEDLRSEVFAAETGSKVVIFMKLGTTKFLCLFQHCMYKVKLLWATLERRLLFTCIASLRKCFPGPKLLTDLQMECMGQLCTLKAACSFLEICLFHAKTHKKGKK